MRTSQQWPTTDGYSSLGFLEESLGRVPLLRSSLLKSRAGLARIDFIQRGLHQDEGLLDEFMELVNRGQGVDPHDGKDLFAAQGNIGRSHLHLFYQSIHPLPSRIIETVQPHENQ
jgi:hypothetical protein